MSHYEILQFIRIGLNYIMNNNDRENIIKLYKLSILIKNTNDERFKKLFLLYYMDYYYERIELITGIKNMQDEMIENIKTIITNSIEIRINNEKKNDEEFKKKYYDRKQLFLNLDTNTIRNIIIEELFSGMHSDTNIINSIKEYTETISYEEQDKLKKINLDYELSKLNDKRRFKFTEEGNFEEDENELHTIIGNFNKRGYNSNHLHIHVYDRLDNTINKLFEEKDDTYRKIAM